MVPVFIVDEVGLGWFLRVRAGVGPGPFVLNRRTEMASGSVRQAGSHAWR